IDQRPIVEALHSSAPHIPVTIVSQDGSCAKSYDCVDDLVCENIENTSLVNPDSSFGEAVMRQTVEAAGRYAKPGDVVLLAPACASMDQFVSYADRGNRFAKESQRWVHNHGVQQ
ncbi:UDP-N-acetylmuramoylalanine--D-glutamate ligase, partial [Bifidobacteriaceae bacterium VN003]